MIVRLVPRRSGRSPILAALVLTAVLSGSLIRPAAIAAETDDNDPLDLAAMALTPSDLEAVGLEGYEALGSGSSASETNPAFQAGNWGEEYGGGSYVAEQFDEAIFQRSYPFAFVHPDPLEGRFILHGVFASLSEFASADGAADGFAILDEMRAESTIVDTVDLDEQIGEEAFAVRNEDIFELTIVFRTDRVVAFLNVKDFGETEPETGEFVALADRLLVRIDAGLDGGGPGLALHALHLADNEHETPYEIRVDQYLRRDDETIVLFEETPDDFDRLIANAGAASDVYRTSQFVQGSDAVDPDLPNQWGWQVDIYGYDDESLASYWFQEHSQRIADVLPEVDDVEIIELDVLEDVPTLGDESFAVAYVLEDQIDCGCTSRNVHFHLRLGAVIATVTVGTFADPGVPIELAVALAEYQASCLADGGCHEPVLLSTVLTSDKSNRMKWDVA